MEYQDIKIGQAVVTLHKNKWVTAKVCKKTTKLTSHTELCIIRGCQNSHQCYCQGHYKNQVHLKIRGRKTLLLKEPDKVFPRNEYLSVGSIVLTHVMVNSITSNSVNVATERGDEYEVPTLTFLMSLSDSYGNMLLNKRSLNRLMLDAQTKDWAYLKVRVAKVSKTHLSYTLMPATDKKLSDDLMPLLGESPCSALFHAVVKTRTPRTMLGLNGKRYRINAVKKKEGKK